jgi:hypothetical protein
MLLQAIELAKEPHDIVIVAHNKSYARDLLGRVLDILSYKEHGFKDYRAHVSPEFSIYFFEGSTINFVPLSTQVGTWVARANRVSILFDHKAREVGSHEDLNRWDLACHHIINKAQIK